VVGDGVLDDFEELLLRGGAADGELVQELDHETGEAFESSRNAHSGADFDEDAFGRVDVDLEFAGFVDGRVEESEQTLRDLRLILISAAQGVCECLPDALCRDERH
jgi:hypothetical protein